MPPLEQIDVSKATSTLAGAVPDRRPRSGPDAPVGSKGCSSWFPQIQFFAQRRIEQHAALRIHVCGIGAQILRVESHVLRGLGLLR